MTNERIGSRVIISRAAVLCFAFVATHPMNRLVASDHADPIDPFSKESLEAGITDLFVFPVTENGAPAGPFVPETKISLADPLAGMARTKLTDEERKAIHSLVIIVCVRRALQQNGALNLDPFTYRIHIDTNTRYEQAQEDPEAMPDHDHDDSGGIAGYGEHTHDAPSGPARPTPHEAFLRYGGLIQNPQDIGEEVIIEFCLNDKAVLKTGYPKYQDAKGQPLKAWDAAAKSINVTSGVFDDPFIFPAFFGTNIVAMVIRVPMSLFPEGQKQFLFWATSHEGDRQIDHVGRSLRTQNPRFEILNTQHPRDHVKTTLAEHNDPSLMRDIFLRFNFGQTFAYRRWDHVPDVMFYSTDYPVGFPNGRLLTDDVAAMLAQYGDTLLFELAYQNNNDTWPRQRVNDRQVDGMKKGEFLPDFPYLLPPHPETKPAPVLRLSERNRLKIIALAATLLLAFVAENWLVARWYHRRTLRRARLL